MTVLMLQCAHNGICCVLTLGVDILGNRIYQTQCPASVLLCLSEQMVQSMYTINT